MAIEYGDFSLLHTVNAPRPKLLFSEYYQVRLRGGKLNGAMHLNVFESHIEVCVSYTTSDYRPQVHSAFVEIITRRVVGWNKPLKLAILDRPDAYFWGTAEDLAGFKQSLTRLAEVVRAEVVTKLTPLV